MDEEHLRQAVRQDALGVWRIEVSHCIHCGRMCLAPETDTCSCGAEFYPVTKMIPLGVALFPSEMKGA